MTDAQNEAAKLVVNTNLGLTNVVNMDDSDCAIVDTLDTCKNILLDHCGPYARYAMLVNGYTAGEKFEPSVFTRDGIRVLSSVEFVSPIERYLQGLLTYIGGRVDNYAKDGTTTSMITAATFIQEVIANRFEFSISSTVDVTRYINEYFTELSKDLNRYNFKVENIAKLINENYTEADEIKAASIIAYMQALSSSGGNIQLAECVREIFASSPKMAWDFISYQNNPKESDIPYSVYTPEYDIKFKASLATASSNIFNKALGTEYEEEDVRCIIVSDGIISESFNTIEIMQYVSNYPSDQPLMIVSPSIDPNIIREIDKLNHQRIVPIAVWQYMSDMRIRNTGLDFELRIANAICGCTPYEYRSSVSDKMSDAYTFIAKRVHFFGGYIHIYDTAPKQESTCLHPYYIDKTKATAYYNDLRKAIETQLDLYDNNARSEMQMKSYLVETLNRLACVHRPTLYVGGTVHDQIANADVVQDVLGAIMSSLKHGFVINGVWSFFDIVRGIIDKYQDAVVHECLCEAIRSVWNHLYLNRVDSLYKLDVGSYWNILHDKPSSINDFIADMDNFAKDNNYPILHPVGIYTELLKRMNELAIKFMLTNKIIVRGGVVMPEDKQ